MQEVNELMNIERLVVTESNVKEISDDLCAYKVLNFEYDISVLPIEILQMQNLKVLMIENTKIKKLPDWICTLSNLECIRFHDKLIELSDIQYDWCLNLLKNKFDIDGAFIDELFPEYAI